MTDQTLILEIGFALSALAVITAWAAHQVLRPKHFLRIWTPGGGEESIRLKRLGTEYAWTDKGDGRQVVFKLDQAFARRTPKGGLRFHADAATGALIDYGGNASSWIYMDPKFLAAALLDGRVRQIAQSIKGDKWDKLEKYIMPALIILGMVSCVILYFVYQMYNKSKGGA